LRAQAKRLYHMVMRCKNRFAQDLMAIAYQLYAQDPLAIDLDATVYAFYATTIELCISVCPWAPF
jgi:hypothetical protein